MTPWQERPRLRPAELAEIAGVSTRTVRRAIARGELASVKLGRLRFVPIAAALVWLGLGGPLARPEPPRSADRELRREALRFVAELRGVE